MYHEAAHMSKCSVGPLNHVQSKTRFPAKPWPQALLRATIQRRSVLTDAGKADPPLILLNGYASDRRWLRDTTSTLFTTTCCRQVCAAAPVSPSPNTTVDSVAKLANFWNGQTAPRGADSSSQSGKSAPKQGEQKKDYIKQDFMVCDDEHLSPSAGCYTQVM